MRANSRKTAINKKIPDWVNFQRQVGNKFKQMGFSVSVDDGTNTQKIKGKSGVYHQIDIIAIESSILGDRKFLVETTTEIVDLSRAKEFCATAEDFPYHEPIIVTSKRIVPQAKDWFNAKGIHYFKLEELDNFFKVAPPPGFEPLDGSLQRLRFPKKYKFEERKVFIDEEKQQIICNWLLNPEIRCCLLYGESGSGKTVFSLKLGYDLKANGDMKEVFYLGLSRTQSNLHDLIHSLTSNDQSDMLFIIDNCNFKPDIADGLVRVAQEKIERAEVLFISRPEDKGAFKKEAEYFDRLSETSLQLVANEPTFRGIIQGFAEGEIGQIDIPKVMEMCKANLYFLSLLLEDWDGIRPLHELSEKLLEKVFNRYSTQIKNMVLPRLSVLYQFETPIPFELVRRWGIREDVDRLVADDTVEERHLPEVNYFLPHPAFAEMILEAAEHHKILPDRIAYEKDICKEYIQLKPPYLGYFLVSIHNNGRDDLLKYLLETIDWFDLLKAGYWDPETPIFWITLRWVLLSANSLKLPKEIIWKNVLAEGTVSQLAGEIKKANIYFLGFFIQQLIKFDKDRAKIFVESLPHQLVMESFQRAGIGMKLSFIFLLSRLKQDDLKAKCLSRLDPDQLAEEMRTKTFSIQSQFWFLRNWIAEDKPGTKAFVKELGEEFWVAAFEKADFSTKWSLLKIFSELDQDDLKAKCISKLTPDQLAEEMRTKTFSIQTLFWFLRSWIAEDKPGAKAFIKELGKGFWDVAFEQANFGNKKFLLKIFSKLGQDELAAHLISVWSKQIVKDIQLANLTRFSFLLVDLASVDLSLCNRLLNEITPERLAKIIKDKEPTVQILMNVLKYGESEFRKEFFQAFKQDELLAIFFNSTLPQIGCLMQYYGKYPFIWKAYKIFECDHLEAALGQATLEDIQKFTGRISRSRKDLLPPESSQLQYALNVLQKLQQIDLAEKLENASLHDLAHFLWDIFVVNSTQAEQYNLAVCKLDLVRKFKEAELHQINFFLWNIYETSSTLPRIFQEENSRSIIAEKAKQESLVQSLLETIGIFEIVGYPILGQEIAGPPPLTTEIRGYLEAQIGKSPFLLMRVLKGLMVVDKDWAKQLFQDDPGLTQRLVHFLENGIKPEMTEKTKRLHTECLTLLREQRQGII